MTAPRLRQHTDGRVALRFATEGWRAGWLIITERPYAAGGLPLVQRDRTDADVHGAGWSEAALVALPEPVDVPDGLYPRVVFPSGVKAHHRGDGDCYIAGRVEGYRGPDHARATAVDLLAAALWCEQREAGAT